MAWPELDKWYVLGRRVKGPGGNLGVSGVEEFREVRGVRGSLEGSVREVRVSLGV